MIKQADPLFAKHMSSLLAKGSPIRNGIATQMWAARRANTPMLRTQPKDWASSHVVALPGSTAENRFVKKTGISPPQNRPTMDSAISRLKSSTDPQEVKWGKSMARQTTPQSQFMMQIPKGDPKSPITYLAQSHEFMELANFPPSGSYLSKSIWAYVT